jgi:hypothetical protein
VRALLVDGNRTCSKCREEQAEAEFYKNPNTGRWSSWCRLCLALARRADRAADPEKYRARDRKYYTSHKWRWSMNYNLLARYGITLEQWESMLDAQGGVCAICERGPEGFKNHARLFVDHDHQTDAVRGLLCGPCNTGLGHFRDDPNLLRRALTYLGQS